MKVLVVGKPKYNVILQSENFPKENSKISVSEKIETPGGISVYVACMLAKWGMTVSYAGAIAGDEIGNKIKAEIESYGIDTKYLEINYEQRSNINYVLLNKANGSSTEVEHINNIYAQKFKYDFAYDYVITDGSDMGASIAIANNYPTSKIILLANKVNEQYYNLSKRSAYVCANMNFAEALTKLKYEFNRPKSLVDFYQKIKDLNTAEYILMLRNKGVLYTRERQVKMLPAIPVEKIVDDSNSGAAFFAAYAYGIINGYDMDEVAKVANIAGALALTKTGTLKSIPLKDEVYNMAGLKEGELGKKATNVETPAASVQVANQNPVTSEATKTMPTPSTNETIVNNNPAMPNQVQNSGPAQAAAQGPQNPVQNVAPVQAVNQNIQTEGTTNQNVQ